jgi:hypothetical protein
MKGTNMKGFVPVAQYGNDRVQWDGGIGRLPALGHSEPPLATEVDYIGQVIEEVTYYREQGIPPIPELPDPRPTVFATLLALADPPRHIIDRVVTCFNAHRGFYVALSR